MKSQLVTTTGRHEHPPQPVASHEPHSVRRVGVLDRAALHIGVALIKWGRRPVKIDTREQLAVYAEVQRVRLERERERDHYMATHLPRIF
ncbi:hypothetical protein ABIE21_001979 [Conyzicola nivalis]|uniref:Uncharacterized protein n=1 Tax=Conyzicola nivalis TaxID=1477021 RepID=A0ABV2QN42_9MICO